MSFCLPRFESEKMIKALKEGVVNPDKLIDMTSKERREFFDDIVGVENGKSVNTLFESKLLLKSQKQALVGWAKQITGIKEETRRDLVSRIERMEKVLDPADESRFLEDLVEKRLGVGVSVEEAKTIADLSKKVEETKANIPSDSPIRSTERLEYGIQVELLKEYVKKLKLEGQEMSLKEYAQSPKEAVYKMAGMSKSLLGSMDNSFFGRQGIKVLYTKPDVWVNGFLKSFSDIKEAFKGHDPLLPIKADIASRPNALNGKYEKGKFDLGINSEEAFPESIGEKIPFIGKLFKASEAAFNGGALRLRSDYADFLIKQADEMGLDTTNKAELEGLGTLVNSTTGRGSLGKGEAFSKEANILLFSAKFLKSNIDTLTAHQFDPKATKFSKYQARKNLAKIVGTVATVMTVSNMLNPGSVEFDPRSPNFGKIKINGVWHDITGGMGSLIVLVSRLVPTKHDGKLGFWKKNSAGTYTQLATGKYGSDTPVDVLGDFVQGKLSPLAGLVRDIWKQEDYNGNVPTVASETKKLITPIPFTSSESLLNREKASKLISAIFNIPLDMLGFGASIPYVPKK